MSYYVSTDSDPKDNFMAGMLINSYKGATDTYINGHHVKKGFILIKKSSNIEHIRCSQGQVHGKLFKWKFGIDPQGCTDVDGYGFAIVNGVWKYKSWTLNDRMEDGHVPGYVQSSIREKVTSHWRIRRLHDGLVGRNQDKTSIINRGQTGFRNVLTSDEGQRSPSNHCGASAIAGNNNTGVISLQQLDSTVSSRFDVPHKTLGSYNASVVQRTMNTDGTKGSYSARHLQHYKDGGTAEMRKLLSWKYEKKKLNDLTENDSIATEVLRSTIDHFGSSDPTCLAGTGLQCSSNIPSEVDRWGRQNTDAIDAVGRLSRLVERFRRTEPTGVENVLRHNDHTTLNTVSRLEKLRNDLGVTEPNSRVQHNIHYRGGNSSGHPKQNFNTPGNASSIEQTSTRRSMCFQYRNLFYHAITFFVCLVIFNFVWNVIFSWL